MRIQPFAREAGWIMLIVVTIALACIIVLVGILLVLSPGKPAPIVDQNGKPVPGSLSEKISVNINGAEQLEANPVTLTDPLPAAYDAARDGLMHRIGIGTTRDMRSVETGVFLASWFSRDYTLSEKVNYWRGKFWSKSLLWKANMMTDLRQQIMELKLPVYFLHGAYDYTVAYPLTREFAAQLKAPAKGFYTFEQSAHTPLFEEPDRLVEILRKDVLEGSNHLADKP